MILQGLHLDVGANGYAFASKKGFSTALFGYYTNTQNIRKEAGALIEGDKTHFVTMVSSFLLERLVRN